MTSDYSIVPLNETAALVSFGNIIDVKVNEKIIDLYSRLKNRPFEGFIESVPAYSSLAVFFQRPAQFDTVRQFLNEQIKSGQSETSMGSAVRVPVLFDGDDLEYVAEFHRISVEDVIAIHVSKNYRVFLLGFLPGFAYMGTVDDRIATPRKKTPRTIVPAGSVGIAGMQTGIYPQSSPGGWQLIGRTPLKIFDAQRESPCLLKPGDLIEFYPITKTQFEELNEY